MTFRMMLLAAAGVASGVLALAPSAEAQRRGERYARGQADYVVAESRFGHGTVSGPVRPGPRGGWEVRLPGGTWIPCGTECSETLRTQSVDFWENQGKDRIDNPCGIFGCLSRGFGF